jgi:tetratricopeptide (TPR) repeat protein
MQDQELPQEQPGFVQTKLPWLIAGALLVLYLVTLNHWVSLASLPVVSKITGWDWWMLNLQSPVLFLVTWPIRWFPAAWQPILANAFSALCAVGALGLLARSVALLPHDRTRDQRQREPSEFSLLTVPSAWLPPVFAVLVCGLQLTFWEHATAATGESLNLLLFAYVIRCLLEHRVDERDSWLYKLAFVYGLAITNNWAMIAFLPVLLVALVWIKGARFFNLRLLGSMAAFGGLGLLLYLVLPLWAWIQGNTSLSFWRLLRMQLGHQKLMLSIFPKYVLLLCGLSSVLPVMFMGIRWPSSLGDTSIIGAMLSQFMFRVVHLLFLIACWWVMFDPPFSPRALGFGLPFLPFYYLGALSVGYFSGYFLLLGSRERERHRHHVSPLTVLAHRALFGLVFLAGFGVPTALVYRNLPGIRANAGDQLAQLAQQLLKSLPDRPALVISDEPLTLLLFESASFQAGKTRQFISIDSRSLPAHTYLRNLHQRYPDRWPDILAGRNISDPIDPISVVKMMTIIARSNDVYYLHPTVSFFSEGFYRRPQGLAYRMIAYPPEMIYPPALTEAEISATERFWTDIKPYLNGLPQQTRQSERDIILSDNRYVANFYSRALNTWGVALQTQGRWDSSAPWFQLAADLNSDNVVAMVNAKYNAQRRKPDGQGFKMDTILEGKINKARGWNNLLRENGPFDEPGFSQKVGEDFIISPANYPGYPAFLRQAAQCFHRVLELDPANTAAALWLGNVYLKGKRPEESLQLINEMRGRQDKVPLSVAQKSELIRLEAWALFSQTNLAGAEKVLLDAQKEFATDATIPETLFQLNLLSKRFTNALAAVEQQLKIDPNNTKALLNKGAICIQIKDYERAIPPLNQLLQKEPQNEAALMNRAIAQLQSGKLNEAEKDYQTLVERLPRLHSAYYGLGAIADQRKDARKAIRYFELFLQYAPPDTVEIQVIRDRLNALKASP